MSDIEVQPELQIDTPPNELSDGKPERRILTLSERVKVIDYLRGLFEPIVASKIEITAQIAEATGVVISWQQLSYMIDDLGEEFNLSAKVRLPAPAAKSVGDESRVQAIESAMAMLINAIGSLKARIHVLEEHCGVVPSLRSLEEHVAGVENAKRFLRSFDSR